MESSAVLMESDTAGFGDLRNQLMQKKQPEKAEVVEENKEAPRETPPERSSKKFLFKKGDQSFEVDEDAEFEMMADKRPIKLTLRELKDRAAGDIAVKNRMHSLAEEKKKVQTTFKAFAELAKKDPLQALEYISNKAKEADSEFEYGKYLEKLAEQAEKLGQMDDKERKAWELEKKLDKAEQDLSLKEREKAVVLRKQQILDDYPEIGDQKFSQMVDAVLDNPDLSEGLETEEEILDRVEDLIEETLTQRDIMNLIEEINPDHSHDNSLIFALSDQIRQNPDLDEEDIRDIIKDVVRPTERARAVKSLSQRQRSATPTQQLRAQGSSDFDLLRDQLEDKRQEQREKKNKR